MTICPTPYAIEHFGLTANNNTPDFFHHEQYLSIFENGKHTLISGCSHKGILNITDYFKPDIVIGGFHFMKIEPDDKGVQKLSTSADILKQNAQQYYTCHCTGIPQYNKLKKFMEDSLFYISTGDTFLI